MDDDFGAMSVRAFAQRTGIGLTLAWREIKEGRLRAIKVSSRTLIRHADARAWLESRPDARLKLMLVATSVLTRPRANKRSAIASGPNETRPKHS